MPLETPKSAIHSCNTASPKKTISREKEYVARFHSLSRDMQSEIFKYVPELLPAIVSTGFIRPQDFRTEGLLQSYFAEVYMIPELANLLYHPDLMALDGVTFEQSEKGKADALRHLVNLLAFAFKGSPIRKDLTLVVLDLAISHQRKKPQDHSLTAQQEVNYQVIAIDNSSYPEFFHYSLACLFEARHYETFVHLLCTTGSKYFFPEEDKLKEEPFWYEIPDFKDRIVEIYSLNPDLFKESFFGLFMEHVPPELQVSLVEMLLKELPDGRNFVLRAPRALLFSIQLTKCLFAIDYCHDLALANEVYGILRQQLFQGITIFGAGPIEDEFKMLEMRFRNGPYHILPRDPFLSAELLIAMNRFEDAMKLLNQEDISIELYSFVKRADFHRFLIYNHLEEYKQNVVFNPALVDYDLKAVYRFFDCSDFDCLLNNNLWKSLADLDVHFNTHASRMIYLHLSLNDFKAFVTRSSNLSIRQMNVNALIEIKGDSPEFMEYFAEFAKTWRQQKGQYFHLKTRNMEKLRLIPGALELLFYGMTSIDEEMFLEFLNHERSYELLLERKGTLRIVNRSRRVNEVGNPLILNETVHRRVNKFSQATALKAKIAKNVELLSKHNINLNNPSIWK